MNVYAIQTEAGHRPIKIGVSKHPRSRLEALTDCQPFEASIVHVAEIGPGMAHAVETAAHAILKAKRLRGEWFNVTADQAVSAINLAIEAVERGETVKQMLVRMNARPRAAVMPEDAVRRLISMIGKTLTWRDVEDITTFSTATLRRHYK